MGHELGALQAQQVVEVTRAEPVEAAALVGLAPRGLDELHRRQGLDQEARHVCRAFANGARTRLDLAPHPAQPAGFERHQHQHQQRQLPRQAQHQRHRPNQPDDAAHRCEQAVDRKTLDLGDVAVKARQQIAHALAAVEGGRQRLQVTVEVAAQRKKDRAGKPRVQLAVDPAEHGARDAGNDHGAGDQQQRAVVARQQIVVDQQLRQPGLQQHQQGGGERQQQQDRRCGVAAGARSCTASAGRTATLRGARRNQA